MISHFRGVALAVVTAGILVVPTRSAPAQMYYADEARIQAWENDLGGLTCAGGCPGGYCCPPKTVLLD
jgi:hypothetical protein